MLEAPAASLRHALFFNSRAQFTIHGPHSTSSIFREIISDCCTATKTMFDYFSTLQLISLTQVEAVSNVLLLSGWVFRNFNRGAC